MTRTDDPETPTTSKAASQTPLTRTPHRRFPRVLMRAAVLLVAVLAAGGLYYLYWLEVEYRFTVVDEGAVFQSAAMPPDVLDRYIDLYGIKTVLDLRDHKVEGIELEQQALADSDAEHVWVPMPPAPDDEQIAQAMAVLLDEERHPVIVHCHHGEGRSVMMAALYRVQAKGTPFDEALRLTARLPSPLWPIQYVLRTGFERDDYKTRILERYLGRNLPASGPSGVDGKPDDSAPDKKPDKDPDGATNR